MKKVIAAAGVVAVFGVAVLLVHETPILIPGTNIIFGASAAAPSAISASAPYTGAALTKSYKNDVYRFSLMTPEDFRVQELPPDENGGHAIVLQNEKGEGIQIYITPDPDNLMALTAQDIRSAIPDMQVDSVETVEIGAKHTGVAFMSDNEAFGGASREVWFYFRGNLYQISTYARLDSLMQAVFGTWKFY